MTQYYFLASSLPTLSFGAPPEITFEEFSTLLSENLTDSDLRSSAVIRRYYDILNMRFFWKDQPLEAYGNWNENELEEAILDRTNVPGYMNEFLDRYTEKNERLAHFAELIVSYFSDELQGAKGFVYHYLKFERDLRLVLLALRVKKLKLDLLPQLQFENPDDPLVADILAQKDSPDYEPPEEYQMVKELFLAHGHSPLELSQALYQYRFEAVQEMVGTEMFTEDRIFGYMVRLIMALNWQELDRPKGVKMVDAIIEAAG